MEKKVSQLEEIRTTEAQELLRGANGLTPFPLNLATLTWVINELLRRDVGNNVFSVGC